MPDFSPCPEASDYCYMEDDKDWQSLNGKDIIYYRSSFLKYLLSSLTTWACLTKSCWPLDQFTKTFFWNFQSIQADLCYILIYKQMLEKTFCSNIAPSLSSGNHLFYKAEYMGQSCPNQVWAITFDWGALATWNKHFWTAFWRLFSGIPHLPGLGDMPGARCRHLAPGFSGARCSVSGDMKGGQVGYPWKGLSKCSLEMLISGR